MDFRLAANDTSVTSESAPLIPPIECDDDQDLFLVPLKRPSPRLTPSRYRNVKSRSPPGSPPEGRSPQQSQQSPQQGMLSSAPQPQANPHQSPAMSGCTVKPETPPMYTSPLMSPDSGMARLGIDGSPNPQESTGQRSMATPGSLSYHSPDMSGRGTKAGSSPILSTEANSARQSPQPGCSSQEPTTTVDSRISADRTNNSPSTKATSLSNSPPQVSFSKPTDNNDNNNGMCARQPPTIPPISAARSLRNNNNNNNNNNNPLPASTNVGLALQLPPNDDIPANANANPDLHDPPHPPPTINPALLHPPSNPNGNPASHHSWTVPPSPHTRLSQRRTTPDSAYDRARQVEVRRSEWKHAVYRFPVRGRAHWAVDADLTESSHARLAEVARRSSEGFAFNGDAELAGIYRVLSAAHRGLMEEMRRERRAAAGGVAKVGAGRAGAVAGAGAGGCGWGEGVGSVRAMV